MAAFDRLEQQVHALIERCRRLQAENRELRSLHQVQRKREQELSAKLRLACARVETMLERIRAFEASQHDAKPFHDAGSPDLGLHADQPSGTEDDTDQDDMDMDTGYP